jgi:hypothetical protein
MKLKDAPDFGQCVKIKKTGEVCRWLAYDPESESLMIVLPSGVSLPVPQQEIALVTPEEEQKFLRAGRNKTRG